MAANHLVSDIGCHGNPSHPTHRYNGPLVCISDRWTRDWTASEPHWFCVSCLQIVSKRERKGRERGRERRREREGGKGLNRLFACVLNVHDVYTNE